MSAVTTVQSGMNGAFATAVLVMGGLLREESGQDLIEYALVFTFVALGAIAGLKSVSSGIAKVFTTVGTALTSAT